MARKTNKAKPADSNAFEKAIDKAEDAKVALKGMANKIMESGQQIWLAGLGAFGKAQEEGGKLYEALIKEGSALEKITSKYTTGKVDEVRGAVESTVAQVKDRASDTWDKLEKVFEDRVSRALGGLGIPGRDELSDLSRKVDELAKAVRDLGKSPSAKSSKASAAPKAAAKAKPAAKAPTKKAVSKKVVSKGLGLGNLSKAAKNAVAQVSKSAKKTVKQAQKKANAAVKAVANAVN
jgi:poly(hydroxyalkanoate) granule-associated protein